MNSSITERLARLSPAKRELLEERLRQKGWASRSARAIPLRASRTFAPLSFAQERMWFLNQLEPESPAYHESRAVRLEGRLDVASLEKALNGLVERHEALRTTIVSDDGKPAQHIGEHRTVDFPQIDLRGRRAEEREVEAQRLLHAAIRSPFDLSRDLMLRVLLLRLADDQYIFLAVRHHIASDGWSSKIFWRELAAFYRAFRSGRLPDLPELPLQYADYAAWQREWARGQIFEAQLSYWRKQLVGLVALQLPTDRPRLGVQSFRGARQHCTIPPELTQSLKALSRREGATLFMILLAAFQALLHRYTGQAEIAVGSPIAGRNGVELEGLIGVFVNTLVFRTEFSDNPTFKELLRRARSVCLDAYSHQDLPFEKLVEELQPQRSLNYNPLFHVTFQLNAARAPLQLPGVQVDDMELESGIAKFELSLILTDRGEDLAGSLEYSTDLFEPATITRMLGHFQILLDGIVADPNRSIAALPLLNEAEEHRILAQWNQTSRDYPKRKCVQHLFEEHAKRRPEAVAVVSEERQVSYGELNRRANQLAHYLRSLGVGPEVPVGLGMARSLEMIIGLLGILKAGGAYVPLDPEYPRERTAFMMTDANVQLLLTEQRLRDAFSPPDVRVVCLDRDQRELSQQSEEDPNTEIIGENLAYIIYTSGSTGLSKGVAVEHRQVLNYLLSILDKMELPWPSSFATVSTLGADLGNTVIFSSLCTGAALHVMSRDRIGDAHAMADYFSRHAIDCLKIVPSHLAALQTSLHPESVMPRKLLILGGEAAKMEWVQNLQRLAPGCAILNHYGPTETTIGVATFRMERNTLPAVSPTVPLGRPLANSQIYLLDRNLKPVPEGVAGELYIGGRNLTRGYFRRADLTAEKFIPNPYSGEMGARLFKTGDRARYLTAGNIEFLGRADRQVKIRGHRIEPGEIEAALRLHPDIRESLVELADDPSADKRLIAYVVAKAEAAPTAGGKPRYRLPNGAAVVQLNKNETDYIYREIFERHAYLRHGISIRDGDCIFDVGANIGLFTLFAHQLARRAKIYSFEPNPAVFEMLGVNAALHGAEVRLFNCGLSNEAKRTAFIFFPGFSLLSGFYADVRADKETVKAFMTNQHKAGLAEMAELVKHADEILEERFQAETFDAELRTLSSVVEQEKIEHIDLLKINVEKSELDVLLGIKESDWWKIRQIVLEVDVQDHLPAITSLLERHGYDYVIEQDQLLEGTSLCYVYAIRPSGDSALVREQASGAHIQPLPVFTNPLLSTADLRNFLGRKLPAHMVPSTFIFLEALPLTPNGKVDRRALPQPGQLRSELEAAFPRHRTPVQEMLAGIWSEVLGLENVGSRDNFFELGGHSLLAAQVVSRVRQIFQTELPVRCLFEKPTIAEMADTITALRAGEALNKALPIIAEPMNHEYPASFSQERFWFLSQLEPDNLAYRMTRGFQLNGRLHIEALEQSLSEIVRRHEPLRTQFHPSDGKLIQTISDPAPIPLTIIDLTRKSCAFTDRAVQELFEHESRRPFDLASDLLLRATVVRLSTNENILFLSIHHIAWDHWSIGLFYRELAILYRAFSSGKPSPLPEPSIRYRHYALWQRRFFQGAELKDHLAYWTRQLAGALPCLDLPTDHARKPLRHRRGGRQTLVLANQLTAGLKSLSRYANVTYFMTLLAAFQTFLHRLTGEIDIVVGTPVAGRTRSETESLIGLFLNSLVLRTDLSGDPTFLELLARVREVALEAYDHQELPFEKLVEELQPERDLTRTPIFQVFINLYNFKETPFELDGLSIAPIQRLAESSPQFDLEFFIREEEDSTHVVFAYDSDLFEGPTAARLLSHFKTLLDGIVARPDQRLSEFSLLTESETRELVLEYNNTATDHGNRACIHELFEAQAKKTPDACAVVFDDQQLTYRELGVRANKLAHHLRQWGVGPDVLVGICLERSLEMIVGLLGILKAGGAYLPLDSSYPKERLMFMLQDSGARLIVTNAGLLEELPMRGVARVCLDRDWFRITAESPDPPLAAATPENLAYVIYTSGSTGAPKGVEVQHGGVVNFLKSMARAPGLTENDILLAVTTLSFDISVLELFLPITVGAQVVIVSREVAGDGKELARKIAGSGVTVMQATPTSWRMLLNSGWTGSKNLKALCGGEILTRELAERLLQKTSSLWNLYGPTETTIWSTILQVSSGAGPILLGRPIDNTQVYLLDAHLNPVPIGVRGEIYIGGKGVARGYLHRPELTREAFLHHSFDGNSRERLYRTGDSARWLASGELESLGRMDHQVKLRGFRIEPGEIEAHLAQHPLIREAVVVVRELSPEDKRLVGYVIAHEESLSTADLKTLLQQKLPEHMVPSIFMFLEALPLTPNGKVNRQALPAPQQERPNWDVESVPRTFVEELIGNIWSEVLQVDKVGIHDNFFELGGHSLLAAQVVARIREALQIELPLRSIFEMPVLASLSNHIEAVQWASAQNQLAGDHNADRMEEVKI